MSRSALIYIAIGLCAIGGVITLALSGAPAPNDATGPMAHDPAKTQALLDGSMKKLTFHSAARAVPDVAFISDTEGEGHLSDYEGKYVLLNFWATWCAPCRHEMPMLSELQTELSGDAFEVVTIATGVNPPPAMRAFLDGINVTNLPRHRDPDMVLSGSMGVRGLPVTVILDPEGREIARMQGDAEWNSDSAYAVLRHLMSLKTNSDAG